MSNTDDSFSEACIVTAIVKNRNGLHMRPMMHITATAQKFSSDITVHNDGQFRADANAKSFLEMMTLCATPDCPIRIVAMGLDALHACTILKELIEKESD